MLASEEAARGTMLSGSRWRNCGLILGLSVLVYMTSIHGDFVFDDHEAIVNNKDVRRNTPFSEVFSNDFWGLPISDPESHKSYRPLVTLTFRLNRIIHGMWSPGFHAVNIFLHGLVSTLYFLFCGRLGVTHWTAMVASLLFTVHPIHTEAVANTVGRTELMAGLFFLLTLLSYQQLAAHAPTPSPPSSSTLLHVLWMVVCITLSILSVLSKEQGITVLGIAVAYDIFIIAKMNLRDLFSGFVKVSSLKSLASCKHLLCSSSLVGNKPASLTRRVIVVIISATVIILARFYINGRGTPLFVESDNPASFSPRWLTRTLTYLYLWGLNMWLLLFPSRLCFDWSMGSIPLLESWSDSRNALTIATIAIFTAILVRRGFYCCSRTLSMGKINFELSCSQNSSNNNNNNDSEGHLKSDIPSKYQTKIKIKRLSSPLSRSVTDSRKQEVVLFALSLLFLPYLPASNLLFSVGFVVAERVLYLPSMGACLLVAMGAQNLTLNRAHIKPVVHLFLGIVIVMYGVKTARRSFEWTTTKTLSESALPVNPGNAKVYATIGNHYAQEGMRKCELFYREAVYLRPHYTTAWVNLGLVLLNTDRPIEAEKCYRRAISLKPDHINGNTNMGHLCRMQGRWAEARDHYTTVLSRRPNNPLILYNLGVVLKQLGSPYDIMESEKVLRRSLGAHPNNHDCLLALAQLLAVTTSTGEKIEHGYSKENRLDESIQLYQHGLKIKSDSEMHYELGRIFLHKGNFKEAEVELMSALNLSPSHARAHFELGNVYKRSGEKMNSKRYYETVMKI